MLSVTVLFFNFLILDVVQCDRMVNDRFSADAESSGDFLSYNRWLADTLSAHVHTDMEVTFQKKRNVTSSRRAEMKNVSVMSFLVVSNCSLVCLIANPVP